MQSRKQQNLTTIEAGSAESLLLAETATFNGVVEVLRVAIAAVPSESENLEFVHTRADGEQTKFYEDDPSDSEIISITLTSPVAFLKGETISLIYPNTDNQKITASLILRET